MHKDIFISMIIPSKNEEKNISRCLDSLIKNVPPYFRSEIILADCHSNDKTTEIAKKYPIRILQLKSGWQHSAAAARYIGARFAKGEFIFFIDADMTLEPGFMEEAIDILIKEHHVAAIGGKGKELYIKDGKISGEISDLYGTKDRIKQARFLGGAGLYKKAPLLECGNFNPYLYASEENELAQRLRKNNYSFIFIPRPMITHYTVPTNEWEEFIRKKRMHLFIGIGQGLRISHSFRYLCETLFYYKEFLFFLFFILYSIIMAISAFILKEKIYALFIILPVCILFLYLLFKKRGIEQAGISLIKWAMISIDIFRGLLKRPLDPKAYPTDPDNI